MITNSEGKVLIPVNELSALEMARVEAKRIATKYVRNGTLKRPATLVSGTCMRHKPCEICIREAMISAGKTGTFEERLCEALVSTVKHNAVIIAQNHFGPRLLLRAFEGDPGLAMFLAELARIVENPQAIVVLTVLHAPDGDFLRACEELLPDQ